MDYNRDNHHEEWDKWNSNASNSSYYNQPTHKPYGQAFSIASAACGLLSLMTCCTIVLSLPLGALGLLFAVLAHRKGRKMNTQCVTGITLSCIGLVTALSMIVYSFVMLNAQRYLPPPDQRDVAADVRDGFRCVHGGVLWILF